MFTKSRKQFQVSGSEIERTAERIARVFRAAGAEDVIVEESRKSASRYVTAYSPQEDRVTIRVSDHFLPDKYGDSDIDAEVFTSDIDAMADTVRAMLAKLGLKEPKELQNMINRSKAQRGKTRKTRTPEEILRERIVDKIRELKRLLPRFAAEPLHATEVNRRFMFELQSGAHPALVYVFGEKEWQILDLVRAPGKGYKGVIFCVSAPEEMELATIEQAQARIPHAVRALELEADKRIAEKERAQ
jgi:hypothetical protein